MTAERIDRAVDRLVWNRFALVDASPQYDRVAVAHELVEKSVHDGRLAHPRYARDAHGHLPARPHGLEGFVENAKFFGAAHERRGRLRAGLRRRRAATCSKATKDVFPRGSHRRLAV